MKRKRMASLIAAVSATTFQLAVPIPGCDSVAFDPQAFIAENTCNIFNCDTLFFLQGEHDAEPDDHAVSDSDLASSEPDGHTH